MELSGLRNIGLTEGEIRLYDALLDLGESTRTELAKRSGISPSKIYDVANRMLQKGIISSVTKNNVIHFSAADPSRIKEFLDQKEAELEEERALVDHLMPRLLARFAKTQEEADIEVFYGWDGMRTAFGDIIKTLGKGEWNYIFGASKGHDSHHADIFFSQYYRDKKRKGFGTKIIFNEDMRENRSRTAIFDERPNEIRFTDQTTFTEINLYNETVLIIILLKKPIVLRMRSAEVALSFKAFFDALWAQAKE